MIPGRQLIKMLDELPTRLSRRVKPIALVDLFGNKPGDNGENPPCAGDRE